mgnify:CR=1 FL=1
MKLALLAQKPQIETRCEKSFKSKLGFFLLSDLWSKTEQLVLGTGKVLGFEFRWIFVKTTDAGSYMLEAFTLANNIGHMSLGGACHSVQPLDVRV